MDKKRNELLAFIKKHPKASQHTVIGSGFSGVLKSQYGNSINKARVAAGVPIVKRNANWYKRKLSEEDEKTLILLRNCKISDVKLAKIFNVSLGTIMNSVSRAREKGKQVIDDPSERSNFAVKTYHFYRKQPCLKKAQKRAKELLEDHVIFPLIRKNVYSVLEDIKITMRPYEWLLTKLSGLKAKKDIFYNASEMRSKLEGIINKDHPGFYFEKNAEKVINRIMSRSAGRTIVRNGQYCAIPFTSAQKENLNEIFEKILKPREKRIIYLRYGFEDGYCRTLDQVGEVLNISKERTRQIEKDAVDRLKRSPNFQSLINYLKIGRVKILKAQIKGITYSFV